MCTGFPRGQIPPPPYGGAGTRTLTGAVEIPVGLSSQGRGLYYAQGSAKVYRLSLPSDKCMCVRIWFCYAYGFLEGPIRTCRLTQYESPTPAAEDGKPGA